MKVDIVPTEVLNRAHSFRHTEEVNSYLRGQRLEKAREPSGPSFASTETAEILNGISSAVEFKIQELKDLDDSLKYLLARLSQILTTQVLLAWKADNQTIAVAPVQKSPPARNEPGWSER